MYGGEVGYSWAEAKLDTVAQNKPTNFIRSGRYVYNEGGIVERYSFSRYWQSEFSSITYAKVLLFGSTYLATQYGESKGAGFPLRCLGR